MVIDTSAIVAILMNEQESETFSQIVSGEIAQAISVVTFYEAAIVMTGKKGRPGGVQLVDEFIRDMQIEIAASTLDDALFAREAYFRFGRSYHPARLNLADCFAYALAKMRDEPLLFKGDDFSKTDIVPAWRP